MNCRTRRITAAVLMAATLCGSAASRADELAYQGELRRQGVLVNTTVTMHFALIDEDNQIVWTDRCNTPPCVEPQGPGVSVTVMQGIFSVHLGDVTRGMLPIQPSNLAMAEALRLRVWVNTGSGFEQLSDQPLSSVWRAQQSNSLWQLDSGATGRFALWDGIKLSSSPLLRVSGGDVEVVSGLLRVAPAGVRFSDGTIQTSASPWSVMGSMASYDGGVKVGVAAPSDATFLHVVSTRSTQAIQGVNLHPNGVGITGQGAYIGIDAYSSQSIGLSFGARGNVLSDSGAGLFGNSINTTGIASGVRGEANSPGGAGVSGWNYNNTGGVGVLGIAAGNTGPGFGVRGESISPEGAGVYGQGATGVRGVASGSSNVGVAGQNLSTTGITTGTSGEIASTSNNAVAVRAAALGTSGVTYAVDGFNASTTPGAAAVRGSASGDAVGVFGSNPSGIAGHFNGHVRIQGTSGTTGLYFPDGNVQFTSGVTMAGMGLERIGNSLGIAALGVTNAKIATDAIDNRVMADNAIGVAELANGAVTREKIVDGAINNPKIDTDAINNRVMDDNAVGVAELADGAVIEQKIAPNAVTGGKILDGSVGSEDLADFAVITAKLAIDAVTSNRIADGAVTDFDLANNSVTSAKIANAAILNEDFANNSVTSEKILDGSVMTTDIAVDAVTTTRIMDGAVTDFDLANNSVTTAKIRDNAVNDAKVADVSWGKLIGTSSTIAGGDLAGSIYPNPTLGVGVVNTFKIADNNVGSQDLANDAGSLAKVSGGPMTSNGSRITVTTPGQAFAGLHVSSQDAQIVLSHHDGVFTPGQDAQLSAGISYNNYGTHLTAGALVFQTRGARSDPTPFQFQRDIMFLRLENGRVGIGTANPSAALDVAGGVSAAVKMFHIDHPLDPTQKYLNHACMESSEVLNYYRGNAVLDGQGRAQVSLPDWFDALNTDFSYQLTAIGAPAPLLHVASEIAQNAFEIAGGAPGMKVSWVVTGVRQDAYVKAHPMQVEETKPAHARGKYLYPNEHGQSDELNENPTCVPPASKIADQPLASDSRDEKGGER